MVGRSCRLSPETKISNVLFRLTRTSVVTGRVTNEDDVATSFQLPPWGKVIRANAYFLPS